MGMTVVLVHVTGMYRLWVKALIRDLIWLTGWNLSHGNAPRDVLEFDGKG